MEATYNDLILEKWFRNRENGNLVWKTKSGDLIPLKRMSDQHLDNAIAYLSEKKTIYDDLEGLDINDIS